jgi:hypothetical protein
MYERAVQKNSRAATPNSHWSTTVCHGASAIQGATAGLK